MGGRWFCEQGKQPPMLLEELGQAGGQNGVSFLVERG
jgi:hypothetical protein